MLRTVLQALAYCHENSIVHRDLKVSDERHAFTHQCVALLRHMHAHTRFQTA